MIHDSFGTHACDTARLSLILRETLVEQYTPNVLENLRQEVKAQLAPSLAKDLPPTPRRGDLDLEVIKDAQYAFA